MQTLPADQQLLFQELSDKLDHLQGEEALAAFMGQVLRSLLRRRGDAEFLAATQESLANGLAGRTFEDQVHLAREVVGLVISVRPEIARAWQALHPVSVPVQTDEILPLRRVTDAGPPPAPEPAGAAGPQDTRSEAEQVTAAFVHGIVARRFEVFRVPEPRFPCSAWNHEHPFFLLQPRFAEVVARFVADDLLEVCHGSLDAEVYRPLTPLLAGTAEVIGAFLADRQAEIWRLLLEKLSILAVQQRTAEAKLAAARVESERGPALKVVEVPVSRPRVLRVMGVAFTLGTQTTMRKTKVKVGAKTELTPLEMESLVVVTRLRDLAADAGLDLPPRFDFETLRTLLQFNIADYTRTVREVTAVVSNQDTSRRFLFEKLDEVEKALPPVLTDALVLMLFSQFSERAFSFQELYDVCLGTARGTQPRADRHPFIMAAVESRPRELAGQIREVLRRRDEEVHLVQAMQMLFRVWRIMNKARFPAELQAAVGVLAAFPVVFSGDVDEGAFSDISHLLQHTLTAQKPDFEHCVKAVCEAYRPVLVRRHAERKKAKPVKLS